jgi:hypothetical protein
VLVPTSAGFDVIMTIGRLLPVNATPAYRWSFWNCIVELAVAVPAPAVASAYCATGTEFNG